jgi:hypothetical protein
MNLDQLQQFLLWTLLTASGLYAVTAIAVLAMQGWIVPMQARMFRLEEDVVRRHIYLYLAAFKLLITVFLFSPWLALFLMG